MTGPLDPASFRDPSGFIFRGGDGQLYRQVNPPAEADYRLLMDSGLYPELVGAGLLIEHEEAPLDRRLTDAACRVLRPRPVPFISYPYEWSFSQLQDAARLTLEIQRRALACGLVLKDASAYNVQFEGSQPVFIDTLSFEKYEEGAPWVAYGQFCRHFLAPLALMARTDVRLIRLLALHLDGVPLDLAARLLPWRTRLRPGLLMHLHLHAGSLQKHADTSGPESVTQARQPRLSKFGLQGLLDSLTRTVDKLSWTPAGTEWADYTTSHGYSAAAYQHKHELVKGFLQRARPATVWDLGANVGEFSRLARDAGARTLAFDIDPACVEMNFRRCRQEKDRQLLPLCMDLTNPSPGLGWAHRERAALMERGPADLVMALALIHHLAIGNNVPFDHVAAFFRQLSPRLIVEFVPKDDPQVRRLLRSRRDIFAEYAPGPFEAAFGRQYRLVDRQPITGSGRVLYLWEAQA